MVGSDCGKSGTSTKTLINTMPEEVILLKNISTYRNGKFYFFRGGLDDTVPKESQEKIVNTVNKYAREYMVLPGGDWSEHYDFGRHLSRNDWDNRQHFLAGGSNVASNPDDTKDESI